jgi:hypothetical protein
MLDPQNYKKVLHYQHKNILKFKIDTIIHPTNDKL